jgi:hypothetical protein
VPAPRSTVTLAGGQAGGGTPVATTAGTRYSRATREAS